MNEEVEEKREKKDGRNGGGEGEDRHAIYLCLCLLGGVRCREGS